MCTEQGRLRTIGVALSFKVSNSRSWSKLGCPAPGGGFPGALNLLHDPTMLTIPMARDADQGNAVNGVVSLTISDEGTVGSRSCASYHQ